MTGCSVEALRTPVERAGQTGQGILIDRVVDPPTATLTGDQTCLAQHLEVVGQQRGRHRHGLGKETSTVGFASQLADDGPPHRVAKRPELFDIVNAPVTAESSAME